MSALDMVLGLGIEHTALGQEYGDEAEAELAALKARVVEQEADLTRLQASGGVMTEEESFQLHERAFSEYTSAPGYERCVEGVYRARHFAAHAIAREQHKRDVARVEALIAKDKAELDALRYNDRSTTYWECADARIAGMEDALAALTAEPTRQEPSK